MRKLLPGALFAALFVASSALATTLVPLDVAQLTRASDVVVRARVESSGARFTKDRGRIITDTTLRVLDRLKGSADDVIIAMQPGGEVGDLGQLVHSTARFTVGEEVVVFLERRGPRFTVAGMMQGRFVVSAAADGVPVARQQFDGDMAFVEGANRGPGKPLALPLAELVTQIRAAAGPGQVVAPRPGRPTQTGVTAP